jgi:phosphoglycerate kinase
LLESIVFIDSARRAELEHKVVALRCDCNVPLDGGVVADDNKLTALLPTINFLLQYGCKIVLLSHLGRPKGAFDAALSLTPVLHALRALLPGVAMVLAQSTAEVPSLLATNDIVVLENLRFWPGEVANDREFARSLASLADIYVNDAFACSHRAHASIEAITTLLPSYGGLLMKRELVEIDNIAGRRAQGFAIIGGAKISTKAPVIRNLLATVGMVVLGGGVANYALQKRGYNIGRSFVEQNVAVDLESSDSIYLPEDVVVRCGDAIRVVDVREVQSDDAIVDIGPRTVAAIDDMLQQARFVLWNGPLGLCEVKPFDAGSVAVARSVARYSRLPVEARSGEADARNEHHRDEGVLNGTPRTEERRDAAGDRMSQGLCGKSLHSLVGGGETVAFLRQCVDINDFSYVSTGGGALLEMLAGTKLPGVEALRRKMA